MEGVLDTLAQARTHTRYRPPAYLKERDAQRHPDNGGEILLQVLLHLVDAALLEHVLHVGAVDSRAPALGRHRLAARLRHRLLLPVGAGRQIPIPVRLDPVVRLRHAAALQRLLEAVDGLLDGEVALAVGLTERLGELCLDRVLDLLRRWCM